MPVSTLMWTGAVTPAARATRDSASARSKVTTVGVRPCATTCGARAGAVGPRMRTGAVIPACRSRSPSAQDATANRWAPALRAARATWAAPCP